MIRRLIPLLLCLLVVPALQADQELYVGIVPVTDQSEAQRAAALPGALLHVLRKLSGEREIPAQPALDEALASAGDLLLAFGYRESPRTLADGTETTELELVARFSPPEVDQLVRGLGLRRWRVQREPVVLWVVIDDGRGRTMMPPEYQPEYDGMAQTAETRGLPVAWPGLTPELMEQVDVQLLWGGYTEQLVGADTQTEGVAIVAARRERGEWNVRWIFADASTSTSWRARQATLGPALDEGIHQLADLVASIHAIDPAGQGAYRTEMLLTGLGSSGDYARTLDYLDGLGLVDDVQVRGVGPTGVRLSLALNAEPGYLESVLRQDGVIEAADAPGEYRLVP